MYRITAGGQDKGHGIHKDTRMGKDGEVEVEGGGNG
jgi:hypothetical protein